VQKQFKQCVENTINKKKRKREKLIFFVKKRIKLLKEMYVEDPKSNMY
jgi:hypothetical protein